MKILGENFGKFLFFSALILVLIAVGITAYATEGTMGIIIYLVTLLILILIVIQLANRESEKFWDKIMNPGKYNLK